MSGIETIPPSYDLDEVYRQAFRHVRPPYPTVVAESRTIGISPVGTVRALKGSFNFTSAIGTPLTLPTRLDGWQLPNEPTIQIEGGKTIIETPLNRGDRVQNVLEEINLDNYRIKIRGIIINERDFDAYPDEDVRRLREICEKPGSITVENAITSIFNVSAAAIQKSNFFEVKGYVGAQAYELDLISDQEFELEVIETERL